MRPGLRLWDDSYLQRARPPASYPNPVRRA